MHLIWPHFLQHKYVGSKERKSSKEKNVEDRKKSNTIYRNKSTIDKCYYLYVCVTEMNGVRIETSLIDVNSRVDGMHLALRTQFTISHNINT